MQDFMQFGFSEEASELVNDFLDFGGTCMRPTGELYGISGGKCRKGSESEPAEKRSNLHMRAYIRLMKKAKERGKPADTSGYHSHHAFPSSIFTNKETADKHQVWLTHGEHFAAHHLVYQALKNRYGEKDQRTIKMGYAIARMANGKDGTKLTKKQFEVAMKINSEVQKGKKMAPEVKQKMAEGHVKMWAGETGEKLRGERKEEGAREKLAEAAKKRMENPAEREKIARGLRKHYNDPAERQKLRDRVTGKKWFFNGEKQVHALEAPGPEWKPGRASNGLIGQKWHTDGTKNIRIPADQQPPEGYHPGKAHKPYQPRKQG